MWQQSDCSALNATPDNPSGCLNDLYPVVAVARDDGSGSNSMAFYNVQRGDAPVFKRLADEFTLNDNYHQPVMGGTAVQHTMIGAADAIPWDTFTDPSTKMQFPIPPGHIANPNPQSVNNIAFVADGQWTNCSDPMQPGIAPIVNYLASLPWHPAPNCAQGRYYMINNLSPGFLPNGKIDAASIETGNKVPPSSLRTIGDALNQKRISWAYYGGGFNAAVRVQPIFVHHLNHGRSRPAISAHQGCDRLLLGTRQGQAPLGCLREAGQHSRRSSSEFHTRSV
jgi:phospholipase C